jgi:hypothetical protein
VEQDFFSNVLKMKDINIQLKKNEVKIGGKSYSKSSYEYGVGKINL